MPIGSKNALTRADGAVEAGAFTPECFVIQHRGLTCQPRVDPQSPAAIFRPLRDAGLQGRHPKAPVAELVDALDSKSSSARSAGSIPARGTTLRPCGLRVAQPRKPSKGEACPAKLERSESEDGVTQVQT